MKRLRMWIRELSLSQQLLSIIFLFVTVFAVFIFIFLAPSIQRFSENEMFRLIHNSQENIITYMKNNPNTIPDMGDAGDAQIIHLVYKTDDKVIINLSSQVILEEVKEDITKNIESNVLIGPNDSSVETNVINQTTGNLEKYLYSFTRVDQNTYLVSLMGDSYRVQFSSSLTSGVVMTNVLFVSALFVLLMMWVGSLLIPLNQIKTYIKKVRNDEPAVLNVKRNDEIGEVATALVEMEEKISQESREKQEMIQNISHDLKTPIATIKSYGEAIKDGIYPYETLEKSVDVIVEHADRLENKVKSLIMLNKMDYLEDKLPEGEDLEMNPIIDKVLLSLKVIRPEIEFIRNTDEGVCFHGEEEPWRITVENLIDNALRYAKTRIIVRLTEGDLQVINDGKTIDEERLGTLFHAYEKGTDGQFGLGLSIVYRVCQTYGYHVQAENLTGGVCFHIWKDGKKKRNKKRVRKEA